MQWFSKLFLPRPLRKVTGLGVGAKSGVGGIPLGILFVHTREVDSVASRYASILANVSLSLHDE